LTQIAAVERQACAT